jgi:hypothetical protein
LQAFKPADFFGDRAKGIAVTWLAPKLARLNLNNLDAGNELISRGGLPWQFNFL